MTNRHPPDNWHVWIGEHGSDEWRERINHTGLGLWLFPNFPKGQLRDRFRECPDANFQTTVSTFGKLVFNTLSSRADATEILNLDAQRQAAAYGLQVIWPVNDVVITKPSKTLTSADIDVVANELFRAIGGR